MRNFITASLPYRKWIQNEMDKDAKKVGYNVAFWHLFLYDSYEKGNISR